MHSKWQIWDFLITHPRVINASKCGIYAWSTFDPFIGKLVKESVDQSLIDGKLTTLMADEITLQWFEDNFQSLSLFGNSSSYIIQDAQNLAKECQEFLLNEELMLEGRYLILSFNEDNTFFKKIAKVESIESYKIEAPKFWEMNKLLDFLADCLKVRLSYQAKQIILEKINNTSKDFINILKSLQINFGIEEISISMLESVMTPSRLDKFELATVFCLKNQNKFYKSLLETPVDSETLRDLFYFMQGHLMKIYDISYLDGKAKLSQYDKKILSFSKSWTADELEYEIDNFRELEQTSKINKSEIYQKIKYKYLQAISS